MKEVAKHHRILDFPDAHGEVHEWLAIDCAFIESGIKFAKKGGYKRLLFGVLDDSKDVANVSISVLKNFSGIEGLMWQIPISKGDDVSVLHDQKHLRYLSIVHPDLKFDISVFRDLEYLEFFYSNQITGFCKASPSLVSIGISGLSADLGFLGSVRNLAKLEIMRSGIKSLAGIEDLVGIEDLALIRCAKLNSIAEAADLHSLRSLTIENVPLLKDLGVLSNFRALRTLWLKNKILESCLFVSEMSVIEYVSINAHIIDNDLSPFLRSKSLAEVWFYPTKRSYFPQLTPDKISKLLNRNNLVGN